jgi:uncharacterized membrane protein
MPGQSPPDVAHRLAAKFQMREETARELIQQGGGRVLKHDLTAEEAEHYRSELMAVGVVVMIESQAGSTGQPPAPAALTLSQGARAQPSTRACGAGWTRCPKCGADAVADLTGVCQSCGVVVERYLALHDAESSTRERASSHHSAPPDLKPAPLDTEEALPDPRSVPIGHGWSWIVDAWPLFKDRPWTWIGALLLCYLILIVLSLVPMLGGLVTTMLGPMLSAGLMIGAHAQAQGEGFEVGHLFAGITNKAGPLTLVGVVYLLFAIGIGLVVVVIGAVMMASSGLALDPATMDPNTLDAWITMSPLLALPVLLALLLGIPLTMAMFFAPTLVALNDVPVLTAFKLSFIGCLRNLLPFLIFGLIALVLLLVGSLPFMLGLFLVVPILTIAIYTAYRDIFLEE